jgi:transcriptional regulator with XRE-family HTH domain
LLKIFIDIYDNCHILTIMTGRILKKWREKWGLTQAELAMQLGTYQETISRWERDKRGIPAHLFLALEALENRMKEGK